MFKTLTYIKSNIVTSILIGMVIGLIAGWFIDTSPLRGLVTILSFLMVYPMMVTLDFSSLFSKGNIKLQLITQLINFVYLPLMAYVFGLIFFNEFPYMRLAILLIALLPTSGMTVSWTIMAKGNAKEAIRMIIIGLILGGLLTPFYINVLLGESIQIPFMDIFSQILIIVFIPMFLGFITQYVLTKRFGKATFKKSIKPVFPLFSTLFVVVLITLVMSLRSVMIFNNPTMIPRIIVPVFLGYTLMIVTIHFIGKRLFEFSDRIALINGTVIRSLSLALAIALTTFDSVGPEVALVIAIAYIVQVQMAAWYVKRSIKSYHAQISSSK